MESVKVTFWGVRGSMATPGPTTARIGGNTSCLEIAQGRDIIICDAGTGIRPLGQSLVKRSGKKRISAHILLSHLHWDHFIGLPFFKPLYNKKNNFVIGGPGNFGRALAGVMCPPYFPIRLKDVSAKVKLVTLVPKPFRIGGVHVVPVAVNHPDGALGWRFYFPGGHSLAHVTDNEPGGERQKSALVKWMKGADVLIHDAQYSREDYQRHRGWGHSPLTYPVELAMAANVKRLYLFHFDPEAGDRALYRALLEARAIVAKHRGALKVELAREGLSFKIESR